MTSSVFKFKQVLIVRTDYHHKILEGLYEGAVKALLEECHLKRGQIEDIIAPGAFELPLIAKVAAKTGRYSAVICLGCVIKGETAHFEYISESVAHGLMQASLETDVPISFGVLTTYTQEQAELRAQAGNENKGREAALAAYRSAKALADLS
jgi:6,7-dimethyl-8-ribityllumazine synthase